MTNTHPAFGLQLVSTLKRDGFVELSLADVPVVPPAADEVLIRVEAAPINPSDLGLLLAGADIANAQAGGSAERPAVTIPVSAALLAAFATRVDQAIPVGNEGAGVVIAAGDSESAGALIGRTVASFSGAMYSQYRTVKAADCLVFGPDVAPHEAASCFVNPLTALGMVETMRREGHTALVHTAAASNLGQMLQKICLADGVELVNIVRRPEQAELLRGIGAKHVCDSSAPSFKADLTDALAETGATIAFDAIGGGKLASYILTAMEAAVNRNARGFSRYGSSVHKQVYLYGMLDRSPTELSRNVGMAWGVGGWLLSIFLEKIGPDAAQRLRDRVAAEVRTTFASHYTKTVSLAGALRLDEIAVYGRQTTGEKYLIAPHGV